MFTTAMRWIGEEQVKLQVVSLHFLRVSKRLDHLAQGDEKRGWQKKHLFAV